MSNTDIIIHDDKDNVGVVVIDSARKDQEYSCWIMESDKTVKIQSINNISLGHKIVLKDFCKFLKHLFMLPEEVPNCLVHCLTPSELYFTTKTS